MHLLSLAWTAAVHSLEFLWQSLLAFMAWFARLGGGAGHIVISKAFLIYLVVASIALVVLWVWKGRGWRPWKFNLFPRSIYLHRSTRTDLFLAIVSRFRPFPFAFILAWVTSSAVLAMWQAAIPVMPARWLPLWAMAPVQFLVIFLARDFADFFRHFLSHKVNFLWALHRVHHSAEVLTPLTGIARFHPLE